MARPDGLEGFCSYVGGACWRGRRDGGGCCWPLPNGLGMVGMLLRLNMLGSCRL